MPSAKRGPALTSIILNTRAQKLLLQMLQVDELIVLLGLSLELNRLLRQTTTILRRIFYLTLLREREMLSYCYGYSQKYKAFKAEKIDQKLNFFENQPVGILQNMKKIKKELNYNFKILLPEQQTNQIIENIFETLIQPSFPTPSLRKQNVGEYCNSSLQILMAESSSRDSQFNIQNDIFIPLKMSLLQNHNKILEQLINNKNLLIKIRFQSELINSYQPTTSAFLNIITLLLTLVDCYLQQVFYYLKCYENNSPFELLNQYLKRYNTFRDTTIGLQEKLGFIMKLFTKAFNYLEPQLQIYPGCSLWRCLIKKWVNRMQPFTNKLAFAFDQSLLRVRERNFCQYVQEHLEIHNLPIQTQSNYLSKRHLNESKYSIESQQLQIIQEYDAGALEIILCHYVQYLIDISSNQYSIHWCQSSAQKLSSIFNIHQRQIIECSQQLYANWKQIFQNHSILLQIFQTDINYIKNILKPNILAKVIQQANAMLESTTQKPSTFIKNQFEKLDRRIRFLNEKRGIPLQIEEDFKQFFDFDRTISLNKIQSIIQKARLTSYEYLEPIQSKHQQPEQTLISEEL